MNRKKASQHTRVGRRRYTDEAFVTAWRQCESPAQVARRLGLSLSLVRDYRLRLERAGVVLPAQEVA